MHLGYAPVCRSNALRDCVKAYGMKVTRDYASCKKKFVVGCCKSGSRLREQRQWDVRSFVNIGEARCTGDGEKYGRRPSAVGRTLLLNAGFGLIACSAFGIIEWTAKRVLQLNRTLHV